MRIIEAGCVVGRLLRDSRAHAVICRGTLMGPRNFDRVWGGDRRGCRRTWGTRAGGPWVEIGSGNKIREYVTIHRASMEGTGDFGG